MEENAILDAKNLVAEILSFSSRVKAATLLPPERIRLQRRIFDCYVLHFYDSDLRGNHSAIGSEETIWIDKKRNVIVKTQKKIESYQLLEAPGARIPISIEETTLYMKVELNGAEPAKSFVFLAPLGSRRVDVFPDSLIGTVQERVPELIGKPAPDVEWQGTEGSVKLSAFRGKPVLIEFWASWCAACIDLIPELKQLYAETADHGLVWLSIDEDVDPTRARDFLRENRVPWPNYHDKNGLIEKAFARETIPLVVLVDRDGKVFFYKSGYETSELRAAIVQLGAEFRQIQGNANRK